MNEPVKPLPKLKKRTLSPKQRKSPKTLLGEYGELQATKFLRQLGYQIIGTNLQFGKVELDIVAITPDQKELVFVEVKTRNQSFSGHPSLAVTNQKQKDLIWAAQQYLNTNSSSLDYRFDVISVLPNKIEHFENITWNRV